MYICTIPFTALQPEEEGTFVKVEITSITSVLQNFLDFSTCILHFDVGRSRIEWILKIKIKISVYTGVMLTITIPI